jgi:hypothetical protein
MCRGRVNRQAMYELSTRFLIVLLRISCLAGNELVPSMTKNMVSGFPALLFIDKHVKYFKSAYIYKNLDIVAKRILRP